MKHFLYVHPVIYTNCIFSVSWKIKTMAIDYQQVYVRLINLFNLVHFHLMKMESTKYIKYGGKQEVFRQEKFALVSSFYIHIFDSGSFSMSYGCVSISVLRIILSVSWCGLQELNKIIQAELSSLRKCVVMIVIVTMIYKFGKEIKNKPGLPSGQGPSYFQIQLGEFHCIDG